MPSSLKITVLCYVEDPQAEPDGVVPQVTAALKSLGHKPTILKVCSDLDAFIDGVRDQKPDLVFNLLEQFGSKSIGSDIGAVGVLDLLNVPYTGGGPGEFYLSGDKGLSKKVLSYEGILFPKFAVFSKNADMETGGNLRMPLFVKPLRMDASIGIDGNAIVSSLAELSKKVTSIHEKLDDAALAEEYIDGREFYVGILDHNGSTVALPPIEMDFTGFPEGKPKVMDARAKFDETSDEYKGSKAVIADIPSELSAKLKKVSLDAARALRVRDYGRVDLRYTPTGEIYVLEVNASCYLEEKGEFIMAAKAHGIEYPEVLQKIIDSALVRQKKPRKRKFRG